MASRTGQERQERPSSLDGEHRSPGPAHRRAQAAGPLGRLIRVPPALAPGLRPLHRPVHRDPGPDGRGLGVTRAWLGGRRYVAHGARQPAAQGSPAAAPDARRGHLWKDVVDALTAHPPADTGRKDLARLRVASSTRKSVNLRKVVSIDQRCV
jgi:hypothetical protein